MFGVLVVFADMSGRKLWTHEDRIKTSVSGVLVGIKRAGVLRMVTGGKWLADEILQKIIESNLGAI